MDMNKLQAAVAKFEAAHESLGEINARLQAVEQVAAEVHSRCGSFDILGPGGVGASWRPGAEALSRLADNPQFASVVEAAQRNQAVSLFNVRANLDRSIKAALVNEGGADSNGANTMPSRPDRGPLVGPAMRPLRLLDVLPSRPVTGDAVEYVRLIVEGDAAGQEGEGSPKARLDLNGESARAEIETVAGWTPASKQVLADHGALQGQIDLVIRHKVLSALEHKLINGQGGSGAIEGFLTAGTLFVPTIGTTAADVIGEALVTQANLGFQPNLVLLNPLDWYRIQITKTETEGEYIFGSPTMPVPPALWNTAIVVTPSVAQGTGLTVDTAYTSLLDRQQLVVTLSNSHEDYFVRNLVAILGELRAGLEVLHESAVYHFDLPDGEITSG